jgi:hypothetical protein
MRGWPRAGTESSLRRACCPMEPAKKKQPDETGILDRVYTPAEYAEYADGEARRMLGVNFADALARMDRGELAGTLAEVRLKLIKSLM